VHDGMRLSRAGQQLAFAHNSSDALNATLEHLVRSDDRIKTGHRNVFIAVEAVYSMDGDVVPLEEIVQVIHKTLPLGNGHLIVDEAHSNGVLGPQGRGLVCELGLEDEVSVRLHTFGKALACNGGMSTMIRSMERREHITNVDVHSHSPLLFTDTPIPHQLRSTTHLHNLSLIPCPCRNQSLIHLPAMWEDRNRKRLQCSRSYNGPLI
jgi:7-keto-8-aminopelargonate synthetase-like enzyme